MTTPPPRDRSIKRLKDRHLRMANLTLGGLSSQRIAEVLGCSVQSVTFVQRSPLFVSELNRRRKLDGGNMDKLEAEAHLGKVRSILNQSSELAAMVQVDLLEGEDVDPSTRLRASNSILDRVLGPKDSPSAGVAVNVQITGDDTKLLMVALKESSYAPRQQGQPAADASASDTSENGQGDVHEETLGGPG